MFTIPNIKREKIARLVFFELLTPILTDLKNNLKVGTMWSKSRVHYIRHKNAKKCLKFVFFLKGVPAHPTHFQRLQLQTATISTQCMVWPWKFRTWESVNRFASNTSKNNDKTTSPTHISRTNAKSFRYHFLRNGPSWSSVIFTVD